jgi:hypothetical protein
MPLHDIFLPAALPEASGQRKHHMELDIKFIWVIKGLYFVTFALSNVKHVKSVKHMELRALRLFSHHSPTQVL